MPPAALPGAKLLKSLTNRYEKGVMLVVPQTHLSRFLKSGHPERRRRHGLQSQMESN